MSVQSDDDLVPLLRDDQSVTDVTTDEDHRVVDCFSVKTYKETAPQQLRELLSLLLYFSQTGLGIFTLVLLYKEQAWPWASTGTALLVVHHVVMAVVVMTRNGWVGTAWNYCCGVFMFNPLDGFDFLEEGCVGIIVAGACWMMYLALAVMGLGFLSYCLLCYLITALVFSLVLLDLSMLAATLLHNMQLLQPSELLYIENYRASRLVLQSLLQSLPLVLVAGLVAVLSSSKHTKVLLPTLPVWLPTTLLLAAAGSIIDAVLLVFDATRVSGTGALRYLGLLFELRGAVKVPGCLMGEVVESMVRADGMLRIGEVEVEGGGGCVVVGSGRDIGCQHVPGYLLPVDSTKLAACQVVAAVREAVNVVAAAAVAEVLEQTSGMSCRGASVPHMSLEAGLGKEHNTEVLLLALRSLGGLESIWMSGGQLGGLRFHLVGNEISTHFCFRELRLREVQLDQWALAVLQRLLEANTPLCHLEVVRCPLPAGRIQGSFLAALNHNSALRYLSLSGTKLQLPAVQALAQVLRNNNTLQHLDISFCNIREEGALALSNALRGAPSTLQHLAIAPSDIGPHGTAALVRMALHRLRYTLTREPIVSAPPTFRMPPPIRTSIPSTPAEPPPCSPPAACPHPKLHQHQLQPLQLPRKP